MFFCNQWSPCAIYSVTMILVTGGCSFSETVHWKTWNTHLQERMGVNAYHEGLSSAGNGLISRRIIHRVTRLLDTHDADQLLVGVMWSGPNRHDYFNPGGHGNEATHHAAVNEALSVGVTDHGGREWVITNPWWRDAHSTNYYRNFFSEEGAYVLTLEHMLRTQWFLERHGVRYFMGTYTGEVLPVGGIKRHFKSTSDMPDADLANNPNTAHLYAQLDRARFLPVEGMYEWCRDHSGLPFARKGDNHPSEAQHQLFMERVVWPHINP